MITLSGRTAVMSGATMPQGYVVVRALLNAGMNVALITHNSERAKVFLDSLGEERQRCIAVSNKNGDAAALEEIYAQFGSIDVLIPNQGGPIERMGFEETTDEALEKKLKVVVMGNWRLVKACLPYLEKSSCGRIILMTSVGALNGYQGESFCDSVARSAIVAMTYRLAREFASKNITVNCIAKGHLESGNVGTQPAGLIIGRNGSDEEFAATVEWLASEESGYITGQVINLNGGIAIG